MYKNHFEKRSIFKVSQNREKIKEMHYNYQKIDAVSKEFKEFMNKKQESNGDKVLDQLVGTWYYYAYRPDVQSNKYIISCAQVTIYKNAYVKYIRKNIKSSGYGSINTTLNEHQSFFTLTNSESANLSIITLNNKDIYKNVFKVHSISKPFGQSNDVLSIGIFSRLQLEDKIMEKTLGDTFSTVLLEGENLEKRINQIYLNFNKGDDDQNKSDDDTQSPETVI